MNLTDIRLLFHLPITSIAYFFALQPNTEQNKDMATIHVRFQLSTHWDSNSSTQQLTVNSPIVCLHTNLYVCVLSCLHVCVCCTLSVITVWIFFTARRSLHRRAQHLSPYECCWAHCFPPNQWECGWRKAGSRCPVGTPLGVQAPLWSTQLLVAGISGTGWPSRIHRRAWHI